MPLAWLAKAQNFAPRTLQINAMREYTPYAEILLKWKRKVCYIPMIIIGLAIPSIIPLSLMCYFSLCTALLPPK